MVKGAFSLFILFLLTYRVFSQELEPRSYADLPVNLNVISLQAGTETGNVLTDAALPIKNLDVTIYTAGLGYVRTFGLAGKLARIQVSVPFAAISGNARINGVDTTAARSGLGDTRLKLGINLIGSTAMDKKQFAHYTQDVVVGVSLVTSIPTGLYYPDKLINIGSNRWGFKPEAGISKRFSNLYLEAYAGVWFYTDNTSYLGHKTLSQQPMGSFQVHACYYFKNKMWVSADGNWFNGGKTLVNMTPLSTDFDNWRVGGAFSVPVTARQSLKLQFHQGAFTNRGYNYTAFSLAYQYLF